MWRLHRQNQRQIDGRETTLLHYIYVNLLCFGRVNGNHARVERHRVSGSPADEAATLPFSGLVGQHMLSCVVNIVAIVAGLASVQFNHIFADNFVGCKAQQTLHARVDISDVEMSVRHRHQFYGERSNNWSFWIVNGQSLGSNQKKGDCLTSGNGRHRHRCFCQTQTLARLQFAIFQHQQFAEARSQAATFRIALDI